MLSLRQVSVSHQRHQILHDIDLHLRVGELTVLLGSNGAGKSTLLEVLAGLQLPQHGEVVLADQPLQQLTESQRAQHMAVLLQQQPLNFEFSVQDVVAMGVYPHPLLAAEQDQLVLDCLGELELSTKKQQSYLTLSGGEQQRVQLARVLVQCQSPGQWLLLDEPLAAMDLRYQHLALQAIQRRTQAEFGAFVILHDPVLAAQYADRIILLKQGKVFVDGAPQHVLTATNLTELYGLPVEVQWNALGFSLHSSLGRPAPS